MTVADEPGETFAQPLELGRVLLELGRTRSLVLEQRSNVDEPFDVQQESVDIGHAVGTGIASFQATANAEPSLDSSVGTAPVEVACEAAKGLPTSSIS